MPRKFEDLRVSIKRCELEGSGFTLVRLESLKKCLLLAEKYLEGNIWVNEHEYKAAFYELINLFRVGEDFVYGTANLDALVAALKQARGTVEEKRIDALDYVERLARLSIERRQSPNQVIADALLCLEEAYREHTNHA